MPTGLSLVFCQNSCLLEFLQKNASRFLKRLDKFTVRKKQNLTILHQPKGKEQPHQAQTEAHPTHTTKTKGNLCTLQLRDGTVPSKNMARQMFQSEVLIVHSSSFSPPLFSHSYFPDLWLPHSTSPLMLFFSFIIHPQRTADKVFFMQALYSRN